MYGIKPWTVSEEDVRRLLRTWIRMVRWMCGASLNASHRVTDDKLRDRLGLERISVAEKR